MGLFRKLIIACTVLLSSFAAYVWYVNRNSTNMTLRQKILKAVYPAFVFLQKMSGKTTAAQQSQQKQPPVSFYSLSAVMNNGSSIDFNTLKGKKVLLVNTASNCGYTAQYSELQQLQEKFPEQLVIIGFPANDFKEQEKGSDEEIATFCTVNFGVRFPLIKKSIVKNVPGQHMVYQWLTNAAKNGWNNQTPEWNFSKYLVNEEGMLVGYFAPAVSPLSPEILKAVE